MKKGQKYIINYGLGISEAEIIDVLADKAVVWRIPFRGGRLGFFSKITGFYFKYCETIESFKERILQ